ncbi:MAG: hypothetical protein ISR58_06600 [Anaerolineales bacterium]|nr:hypothetical protein [Chloroflexota bacterium]MBL6980843.1 hypothetical protein [Anaerolineales bacterium]
MAYHGAHIAAAAAAKKRKLDEEAEEEKMTKYNDDNTEKWEYKIVRSESGAFRNPNVLAALVEEEALAGWEMLEKFDNRRIRFRRPVEARKKDHMLPNGVDPYRTNYGGSLTKIGVMVALGLLLMGSFLFFFLAYRGGASFPIAGAIPTIAILVVLMAVAAVVAVARSR